VKISRSEKIHTNAFAEEIELALIAALQPSGVLAVWPTGLELKLTPGELVLQQLWLRVGIARDMRGITVTALWEWKVFGKDSVLNSPLMEESVSK